MVSSPGFAQGTLLVHINSDSETTGRGNTAFPKFSSPVTTVRNKILAH